MVTVVTIFSNPVYCILYLTKGEKSNQVSFSEDSSDQDPTYQDVQDRIVSSRMDSIVLILTLPHIPGPIFPSCMDDFAKPLIAIIRRANKSAFFYCRFYQLSVRVSDQKVWLAVIKM